MGSKVLVSAVIVSYNTQDLTAKSIDSVYASSGFGPGELEVIVVDNASTDGSPEYIAGNYPDVLLVRNSKNAGFGAANNQGIAIARGKYILLLNSDAFLGKPALRTMVEILEKRDGLMSVGPQLLYENGSLQLSGGYLPTPGRISRWLLGIDVILNKVPVLRDHIQMYHVRSYSWHQREQSPDWLMGACVLFRRDDLEAIGGFDPKIFMYAEEVDLFVRLARKTGHRVLFTPSAQATHIGGVSTAKSSGSRLVQELRGIEYLYRKNSPGLLPYLKFVIMVGVYLRILAFSLIPGKYEARQEYLKYIAG